MGFRWFTKYTKFTSPELSWLCVIEITTIFISLIPLLLLAQIFLEEFSQVIQNGIINPSTANGMKILGFLNIPLLTALSLLSAIVIYYIVLSFISKLILPISIGEAFKSSILNLIIYVLISAPFIAYFGWAGMKIQNSVQNNNVKVERDNHTKPVSNNDNKVSSISNNPSTQKEGIANAFYSALSEGDGKKANTFIIPEKRNTGNFQEDKMSSFYGNMKHRLQILEISSTDGNAVKVKFEYSVNDKKCSGTSLLIFREVLPSGYLIEKITSNC